MQIFATDVDYMSELDFATIGEDTALLTVGHGKIILEQK